MLFDAVNMDNIFPAILRGNSMLVPIKIDIVQNGARYVDSFCWDVYNLIMTPDEFALRTCIDLNLHQSFRSKIALQIAEQIDSYDSIVSLIKMALRNNDIIPNSQKIRDKINMSISVRHNTIEYSDKLVWDPMSSELTPEKFAKITVSDLGLPADMEPGNIHENESNTLIYCNGFT